MVSRDRGQLILVGAIAIALILLGLVLIVNTALFTQVVGSEGTTEAVKEGGVSGQEIGDAVAAIAATENRNGGPLVTLGTIESRIDDDVDDNLEPALARRSVESGGSIVSVEYRGFEDIGTRIAQDGTGTFEDANGNAGWSVVNDSERADIGGFVLVVASSQSSPSSNFEAVIEGAGGDTTTVTVTDAGSGSVDVEVAGPSTTTTCTGIAPTNDTVRVDVSAGSVYEEGSCQFDAFANVEPGYSVDFVNGDQIEGTWQLVTANGTIATNLPPRFGTGAAEPTRSTAVWSFEYRFSYDTGRTAVESDSREVPVYD